MKCPACGRSLVPTTVEDVTVDVCEGGCGGIWFDNYELEKLDEPHELAGEALLDIEKGPGVEVDREQRLTCPKCGDVTTMRHFFSPKRQVEIDECQKCGGIWLDYGELGRIRKLYSAPEERKQAFDAYFDELFGDKVAAMRAGTEQKRKAAKKIADIFRFICPSYYIPGKQDGAAF